MFPSKTCFWDLYCFFLEVASRASRPDDLLALANFSCLFSREELQQSSMKLESLVFLLFSCDQSLSTHTAVHHVCTCDHWRTHKIQVQMKQSASSTAMKAERNAFALPDCILLLFQSVIIIT